MANVKWTRTQTHIHTKQFFAYTAKTERAWAIIERGAFRPWILRVSSPDGTAPQLETFDTLTEAKLIAEDNYL